MRRTDRYAYGNARSAYGVAAVSRAKNKTYIEGIHEFVFRHICRTFTQRFMSHFVSTVRDRNRLDYCNAMYRDNSRRSTLLAVLLVAKATAVTHVYAAVGLSLPGTAARISDATFVYFAKRLNVV